MKALIRYAKDAGLDALECVPPARMGNLTLDELHRGMDGMVLFDGIPATHFLDLVSTQDLEDFTKRVLEFFSPKIVLGISDQLPPNGDIEKVRAVSEMVEEYTP